MNGTIYRYFTACIFLLVLLPAFTMELWAQDKTFVQLKVFDQKLKPVADIQVSINEGQFISLDNNGTAFVEFDEADLPPKTVKIQDPRLEAESWNYSKGILEVIVREKTYQMVSFQLTNTTGDPIPNTTVSFKGRNEIVKTTGSNGTLEIPVAFETQTLSKQDFSVQGHSIVNVVFTDKEKVIIAKPLPPKQTFQKKDEVLDEKYFENFDLKYLDSIQSLTVFYAVFKNYQIGALDEELKKKIDSKFNELINKLQDTITIEGKSFIGKISDSSFVNDDLQDLLEQATAENVILDQLRGEFDEKIKLINEKLKQGGHELDAPAQEKLLADITRLEMILEENEQKFYRNQTDYRTVLNTFKDQLLDIKDLERKLYVSETQRVLEKEYFDRQLLIISAFTLIFGLLTVTLYYFSRKLQKKRKELVKANNEVKQVNTNLENLVNERTQLLVAANNEMDTFLYRASHNLRRPICSILGLSHVAKISKTSEVFDLFAKVEMTAKEMDDVLTKLLVINDIHHPDHHAAVDFEHIMRNLREKYGKTLQEKNILLKVDFQKNLSLVSLPHLIEIILDNLLENAVFYSALTGNSQPEVHISLSKNQDHLELVVYDNGTGIDQNIQKDIWNMFFLGDDKSNGNGLGLYIVKKTVETLKGNISVESVKNEYSRFTVKIPFEEAETV